MEMDIVLTNKARQFVGIEILLSKQRQNTAIKYNAPYWPNSASSIVAVVLFIIAMPIKPRGWIDI